MDCFGTYFTHVQTCDDKVLQKWTASVHNTHMACPILWRRSCSKCYGMDFFGTYFIHVQTCDDVQVHSATEWTASVFISHIFKAVDVRVQSATEMVCFRTYYAHVQTCEDVRVQSATEWILRFLCYTCPNLRCPLCSKSTELDCFGTYVYTHVQPYGDFWFHSAIEWTALKRDFLFNRLHYKFHCFTTRKR